ncbi:MAG: endonuclease [Lachnospiraceae bacterium]|nr:endonuclease [Lachnospiraceae bacterium]
MKVFKKILKILGIVLLAVVVLAAGLVGYLSITEYDPADTELLNVEGKSGDDVRLETGYTLLSWNIGYGALGDNADFFMDGGSMVQSSDKARVQENLGRITDAILEQSPDFVFLQETDVGSKRSYHIDQTALIGAAFPACQSSFAYNYKTAYVPYPLPPIGKVQSGLFTLSACTVREASRVKLPCPFTWPVSTVNLKRCLLVSRLPIAESGKELVLINLHLEAYDDGEGKIAQTKLLREILEAEAAKGNFVIAGGDFNQTFSNVDLSKYPQQEGRWASGRIDISEFDSSWQFLMTNEVPSCRSLDQPYAGADHASFQYYVIDGFIVSSNVEVQRFEVLDKGFVNTDHNPTLLNFCLKEEAVP